jgi:multidrug efflux pump subunit AcrB
MRVWLDPNKVKSLDLSPAEIITAIQSQNRQAALGKIGAPPTYKDQQIEFILTTEGRLDSVREFNNIVIKYQDDGTLVHLKDVATIELGSEKYDWNALLYA